MSHLRRAWRRFWSKPAPERRAMVAKLIRRVRANGPSSAIELVRGSATPEDEAARYLTWCARHTPDAGELQRMTVDSPSFAYRPLISIVTPVYNTDARWLDACAASVIAQAYPQWQWCIGNDGSTREETRAALDRIAASDRRVRLLHAPANGGIAAATNLALSVAEGDYVALMDSDDALLPHALFRMVQRLNAPGPRADVLYSDEDKLDLAGVRCDAYFKPDWSPDLFLSSMFVCHLLMARRALVDDVGGFRSEFDFSQDYDLMLRLMEKANRIDHVADVLYHWRKIPQSGALIGDAKPTAHLAAQRALQDYLDRNAIAGEVVDAGPPGLHRIKYRLTREPLVSLVMPTRGATAQHFAATIAAIHARTAYRRFELIVVSDDGDVPAASRAALDHLSHRVVKSSASESFNFSRKVNEGVRAAAGEQILILHDDIEPLEDSWLESMLQLSEQPGIGAVGAKLYYSHGALQHIGLIVGLGGLAGRPFQGHLPETVGYYSSANCIRNYSAVSAACLMTRRDVFERVGGFDEALPWHGSDIDYGLKLRSADLRVVFTPYARLTHHEAGGVSAQPVTEATLAFLRQRWGDRLDRDPFYNSNLSREDQDYRVAI